MNKVVILAPKNYFIFEKDGSVLKQGFKGVNIKNDDYINCDKLISKSDLIAMGFQFTKNDEVKFKDGLTDK